MSPHTLGMKPKHCNYNSCLPQYSVIFRHVGSLHCITPVLRPLPVLGGSRDPGSTLWLALQVCVQGLAAAAPWPAALGGAHAAPPHACGLRAVPGRGGGTSSGSGGAEGGQEEGKCGQAGKKADGAGGGGGEKRVTPKSEDFSRCAAPPAPLSCVPRPSVCREHLENCERLRCVVPARGTQGMS